MSATAIAAPPAPAPPAPAARWSVDARSLPTRDLLLVSWLALISLAHLTFFRYPLYTSRFLLVLVIVPYGAVRLAGLARRRDRTALAWCGLLGALLLSALLSVNPRNSLLGIGGSTQSVTFFVALGCVWAAGRDAGPAARRLAEPVLVVTLGVHLAVGIVQVALDIDAGPLATFPGRAAGLATNAVYFGALMTIGVVAAGRRLVRARSGAWLVVLAASVFGVSLSGSRAALAASLLVLGALAWARRPVRVWPVVGGVVAGIALAQAFSWVVGARTSLERAAADGADRRVDTWRFGVEAFLERPGLGWGPDLFRAAVQGRLTDGFVRRSQELGEETWSDPHNLVVGLAVGAGALGLAAFAVLVWQLARRSTGPLALVALAIALTWLLQPMVVVTAPIVAMLLGMAHPPERRPALETGAADPASIGAAADLRHQATDSACEQTALHRTWQLALVAVGVALAGTLAVLDLRIAAADDVAEAGAAWEVYWHDPRVADEFADRYMVAALDRDPAYAAASLEWAQRAVDWEPEVARWWARLGSRQLLLGDPDGATASVERALELQPNEPQAWLVQRSLAELHGDADLEQRAIERVCALVPDRC